MSCCLSRSCQGLAAVGPNLGWPCLLLFQNSAGVIPSIPKHNRFTSPLVVHMTISRSSDPRFTQDSQIIRHPTRIPRPTPRPSLTSWFLAALRLDEYDAARANVTTHHPQPP